MEPVKKPSGLRGEIVKAILPYFFANEVHPLSLTGDVSSDSLMAPTRMQAYPTIAHAVIGL